MHPEVIRAAHADVWEAHGRHREAYGGGATRVPGVRLMAAGLPHPQWNSGDVVDPEIADIEAVRRWYDDKGVPWGLRVALGADWPHGRRLLSRRLMALAPDDYAPEADTGASVRAATVDDLEAVLAVDPRGVRRAGRDRSSLGGADPGVNFIHLSPDTDDAVRIYARLGFAEVPGFDVYIDC